MVKYEINRDKGVLSLVASGSTNELITDASLLMHAIFVKLKENDEDIAEFFKEMMKMSVIDPDSHTWKTDDELYELVMSELVMSNEFEGARRDRIKEVLDNMPEEVKAKIVTDILDEIKKSWEEKDNNDIVDE